MQSGITPELIGFILSLFGAGAIGGLIGEFIEGPLKLPSKSTGSLDLGFLTGILIGAAAGAISQTSAITQSLDGPHQIAAMLTAMATGVGGAGYFKGRSVTNQLNNDNNALVRATSVAATKQANPEAAKDILAAKNVQEIVDIVRRM